MYRVEVEFKSIEEANLFKPLNWFGKEITDSKLGNDRELINLNREQFLEELNKYV